MKVVVLDEIHPCLMQMLSTAGHHCLDVSQLSDPEARAAMTEAEILVLRGRFKIDALCMQQMPHLKVIGRVGAGLEHIDREWAAASGIAVLSSPEGNRQAVAEHAVAMLLCWLNKLREADAAVRRGEWNRKAMEGTELEALTVGIVGFGNTGSAFGRLVSAFGSTVLAYDKYLEGHPHQCTMQRVFAEADVVSLHLPLTHETRQLVDAQWLRQFQKPIFLINTARGSIVNTAQLLDAMDEGTVVGAALDVQEFERENLTMPSLLELPEVAHRLRSHPKVLLSPHVAGITRQSYEKLSRVLAEKIMARCA